MAGEEDFFSGDDLDAIFALFDEELTEQQEEIASYIDKSVSEVCIAILYPEFEPLTAF